MKDKKLIAIFVSLFLIQIGVYTLLHLWNIKHEPIDNSDFKKNYPNYRTLKKIDLSYKDLKKIPSELSVMNSLEAINLGGNYLTDFPYELLKLPKLERLDLEGNQIESVDFKNKVENRTLRVLILNDNPIQTIAAFNQLLVLEELELSRNKLKFVHVSNRQLKKIRLSFNELKDFPSIYSPNLKELNLVGNNLSEINLHRISPSVQKLYLAGNQINNLQFYSDIFFEESNLKVLDLSNNLLKNYPYALHKFPYLEMLNLSENNISKFDNDIAVPLESLKSFHISTNFFSISDINMGLIFPNLKQSN